MRMVEGKSIDGLLNTVNTANMGYQVRKASSNLPIHPWGTGSKKFLDIPQSGIITMDQTLSQCGFGLGMVASIKKSKG
jgi:hypothetical protein